MLGSDIPQIAQGRAWPRKGAGNWQEFFGEVRNRCQSVAERAKLEFHIQKVVDIQVKLRETLDNYGGKLGGEGLEDAELGLDEVDSERTGLSEGEQEAEVEIKEEMRWKSTAWLKEVSHGIYEEEEFQRQNPKAENVKKLKNREARRKLTLVDDNPDPRDHGSEGLRRAQVQDSTLKRAWVNRHCGD